MGKIAFLFAGQGAQSVGMGKDLYDASPAAKSIFDMGEGIRPGTLETCFAGPGEALSQTENTQPCLFLTDLACGMALVERGIRADVCAGFSLGELPALAYAGVLSPEDAFRLVTLRGETMAQCAAAHPGGMAAVLKLSAEVVEEICGKFQEVYPVNYNCPGQISCAGAAGEMQAFCEAVKAAGGRAVPLAVSGAFHTPFMRGATEALALALEDMPICAPTLPTYANRTALPYPDGEKEIAALLASQASGSVRWEETLRQMAADGVDTFVELGAGRTLQGLVKKTLPGVTVLGVSDLESLEATASAINAPNV